MADDYVAKLDSEHRSAAATQAVRERVSDELAARCELDEAVAGLHAVARGILVDETSVLVSKVQNSRRMP